jgi:hypothetical protein
MTTMRSRRWPGTAAVVEMGVVGCLYLAGMRLATLWAMGQWDAASTLQRLGVAASLVILGYLVVWAVDVFRRRALRPALSHLSKE